MSPTRVRIFYPADPVGVVPGGIDTFLRGLIKWAPPDIEFSLVGMTTAPAERPVGRWIRCTLGQRSFEFFPLVAVNDAGGRSRVPLSLRYTLAALRRLDALRSGFEVFDFHRAEPSLLFLEDSRPKNAFFHNDPQVIRMSASDNRWKSVPAIYDLIERRAMARFDSVWCVRESGVKVLRQRHPGKADAVHFVPTWVDADVFHAVDDNRRAALRRRIALAHRLDPSAQWIVSVGRLDTQKDPQLLFKAFARLRAQGRHVLWLVVGDGVLRPELERLSTAAGLAEHLCFIGLRSPSEIADLLRAADVYALSSAYEGMPMALLEALGCGLPAAVTDVGEVRRVVRPGINGAISLARDADSFAAALVDVLDRAVAMRGAPACQAVEAFRPADVLAPVYERYRELGRGAVALRDALLRSALPERRDRERHPVVGVPIDLLDRATASAQLVTWARTHESRYTCFVNVHSAVHASLDERHRQVLLNADMAAADGAPIAWTLRLKSRYVQRRVDGPGTMWLVCGDAQAERVSIGLYGSTPETLAALKAELRRAFPKLKIAYVYSPPFRELSSAEDRKVCDDIAASGVGILFVGLGCPKQELWMAQHRGHIPAVMLGVGAAFEFHAGTAARAPAWMRDGGLEWLHRLSSQPRRLWRRYLFTNSLFLATLAREATSSVAKRLRASNPSSGAIAVPRRPEDHPMSIDTSALEDLVTRVASRLPGERSRLIGFISSSAGEGNSTIAGAYASTLARRTRGAVLLLETGIDAGPGVLQALAVRQPIGPLVRRVSDGVFVARLGSETDGSLWQLVARDDLWRMLRERFDDIAIDLRSPQASRLGTVIAPYCDGVVVVVEAEKTRVPVAAHLVANLRAVRANVLGTVLNKRRYHLPERVYRWL